MTIQTAAYPQEQPVLRAVARIQKKKSKSKSVHVVSDEEEAGPSQEEEAGPEIITWTLSLCELWDMRKDFSLQSGEPLMTWVLWCWAIVAHGMKLDGNDTWQLGFMSWDASIDQAIGKRPELDAAPVKCEGKGFYGKMTF